MSEPKNKATVPSVDDVVINRLCEGSIVRTNLLTVPGYAPYCGNMENDCDTMERAKWDVDRRQFVCRCGWSSDLPKDFVDAYVAYRIDSQVCERCGVSCGENKQKYCGDGSDKDLPHRWKRPSY